MIYSNNDEIIAILDWAQECGGMLQTVIDFGKELPPMWDGYRVPDNRLQGCLSQTYFVCETDHEGLLHIEGESNSVVMRGVVSIFRKILNGEPAAELSAENINWYITSGLMEQLTPQRQGAVKQIVEKILCNLNACAI